MTQSKCKTAMLGWIYGFITATIIWYFRITIWNSLGLFLTVIGGGMMVLFPIGTNFFEKHPECMMTIIKGTDGPFNDFQRQNNIIGLCLIILGFVLQIVKFSS